MDQPSGSRSTERICGAGGILITGPGAHAAAVVDAARDLPGPKRWRHGLMPEGPELGDGPLPGAWIDTGARDQDERSAVAVGRGAMRSQPNQQANLIGVAPPWWLGNTVAC
jgi:hypothetical protein